MFICSYGSFRNERYKHATELSKHIWSLKDQKIAYQIKWWKIKQARSYSNVSRKKKNFSYYADQKCQLSTVEMNLYRVADMLGNFY